MGNKLTRKRHVVDERYTKPQGLYQNRDVDHKKLKKLILDAKLAPCFPGGEECTVDLDECPICFLYYPSLNRSRCCLKGICTECFLQMKPPNSNRLTQCPFCKTSNYAVEYRGAKTQEEKGIEQAEEQKVIEAKIRMRQQELQDEEQRSKNKDAAMHAALTPPSEEVDRYDLLSNSTSDANGVNSTHGSSSDPNGSHATYGSSGVADTRSQPLPGRYNRDDDFDLDLEDIMVMEAIWLSIQENGAHRISGSTSFSFENIQSSRPGQTSRLANSSESTMSNPPSADSREVVPSSSVTGGLACAIATLAERQVLNSDSTTFTRQSSQNHQSCRDPAGSGVIEGQEVSYHNTNREQELSVSDIRERVHENQETEEQQQQLRTEEDKDNMDIEGGDRPEAHAPESWIEVSPESGRALSPCIREGSQGSMSDWVLDHSSEVVEVGTSFSSSVPSASDLPWEAPEVPNNTENYADPPSFNAQPYGVPESFEEQMMLALAISLAEAQTRS